MNTASKRSSGAGRLPDILSTRLLLCVGLLCLIPFLYSYSQEAVIRGRVSDALSYEPLPGVNILVDSLGGGTTDQDGRYQIMVSAGKHTLTFRYIGYRADMRIIRFHLGDTIKLNIQLQPQSIDLDPAVVSASKFEQHLSDVTVSMDVIKARFIEDINTTQLDQAINLVPGVDIFDKQASIRGGSGYSYGAGSRVLVLVDGLPMLTGDVNDVKWNYLPVEIVGQMEIIKGASSAIYGSSALNGVINVRTASPGIQPNTKVIASGGMYLRPERKELSWWWDKNPLFGGIQFSHLRKAGPLDIVVAGNIFSDAGYRKDNYQKFGRIDLGLKYSPPKLRNLSFGIHSSIHVQEASEFLIWIDADSGAFMQNPESILPNGGFRFNIDPYITFFDNRNGKHSLKSRFYKLKNDFEINPEKNNGSDYYYAEYQYYRLFKNQLHWTAGLAASYTAGKAELYGDHVGSTLALFTQFDWRITEPLLISLGFRWERYTIDRTDDESRPVIRAGLNYKVSEHTFIRASYGQGYRYPSIAEKFTSTGLGSLRIFPNPGLEPETGWSTEMGVRQGLRAGLWNGFLDLAAFWMEYRNMMEFTFGIYKPDSVTNPSLEHLGFKSINVGDARINGFEVSLTGEGPVGEANVRFFAGYTYMNPLDLNADSTGETILKYRYRHSAKGDVKVDLKKFIAGLTFSYHSFMERIDEAFEEEILGQEIFPGLKEYRQVHNKGAIVFDFRIAYQFTPSSRITFLIKNLFNKEYMGRPGDIHPPRNISLQYVLKI